VCGEAPPCWNLETKDVDDVKKKRNEHMTHSHKLTRGLRSLGKAETAEADKLTRGLRSLGKAETAEADTEAETPETPETPETARYPRAQKIQHSHPSSTTTRSIESSAVASDASSAL
jgi:hypothetical protein